MRRTLTAVVLVSSLISCSGLKYPEIRSTDGMKMVKINGREINLELKAVVYNPNKWSLKVKPSKVFISVQDQGMAYVQLDQKVKLKGMETDSLTIPLIVNLEEGAMLSMFRFMNKDSVQMHVTGKVKGGVGPFSKNQKVDVIRNVPGKFLQFGMGGK